MGAASPQAAAEGFVAIAVEQTVQAIRRISTERGFDPRGHTLVAFGGAAGQIACWVADALGATEVLSPRYASLLSAWGIGQARPRSLRQAGVERPLDEAGRAAAKAVADRLSVEAAADMAAQGAEAGAPVTRLMLRYDGADAVLAADGRAGFEAAHQRLFGFVEPERGIVIASVEVEATSGLNPSPLGKGDQTKSGGWGLSGNAGRQLEDPIHRFAVPLPQRGRILSVDLGSGGGCGVASSRQYKAAGTQGDKKAPSQETHLSPRRRAAPHPALSHKWGEEMEFRPRIFSNKINQINIWNQSRHHPFRHAPEVWRGRVFRRILAGGTLW
jgi:hypothetical protein